MVLCEKLTDPDRRLLARLAAFSVPELCDGAEVFRAMDYHIKPRTWRGGPQAGRSRSALRPNEAGGILKRAAKKAEARRRTVLELERTGKPITKILI